MSVKRRGPFRRNDANLKYRLIVTVPMELLQIVDALSSLPTLGRWGTSLSMDYGFWAIGKVHNR